MRRAIDLVHYVVKDGIMHSSDLHASSNDVVRTGSNPSLSNRPKEVKRKTYLHTLPYNARVSSMDADLSLLYWEMSPGALTSFIDFLSRRWGNAADRGEYCELIKLFFFSFLFFSFLFKNKIEGGLGRPADGLRSHPATGRFGGNDPTNAGPDGLSRADDFRPGGGHRADAGFYRLGLHVARAQREHSTAVGSRPIGTVSRHPRRNQFGINHFNITY